MVPAIKDNSLLSGGKFAQAGYVAVWDDEKVTPLRQKNFKITVSKEAVLTGWRCPTSNMWCIPLVKCAITNDNTQTLLINEKFQPQDPRYTLLTNAQMHEQINAVTAAPTDTINNVYELPSTERAVRYFHGDAGFPT